jgi:hypothetical protein
VGRGVVRIVVMAMGVGMLVVEGVGMVRLRYRGRRGVRRQTGAEPVGVMGSAWDSKWETGWK